MPSPHTDAQRFDFAMLNLGLLAAVRDRFNLTDRDVVDLLMRDAKRLSDAGEHGAAVLPASCLVSDDGDAPAPAKCGAYHAHGWICDLTRDHTGYHSAPTPTDPLSARTMWPVMPTANVDDGPMCMARHGTGAAQAFCTRQQGHSGPHEASGFGGGLMRGWQNEVEPAEPSGVDSGPRALTEDACDHCHGFHALMDENVQGLRCNRAKGHAGRHEAWNATGLRGHWRNDADDAPKPAPTCGAKNPFAPAYRCALPAGHTGLHKPTSGPVWMDGADETDGSPRRDEPAPLTTPPDAGQCEAMSDGARVRCFLETGHAGVHQGATRTGLLTWAPSKSVRVALRECRDVTMDTLGKVWRCRLEHGHDGQHCNGNDSHPQVRWSTGETALPLTKPCPALGCALDAGHNGYHADSAGEKWPPHPEPAPAPPAEDPEPAWCNAKGRGDEGAALVCTLRDGHAGAHMDDMRCNPPRLWNERGTWTTEPTTAPKVSTRCDESCPIAPDGRCQKAHGHKGVHCATHDGVYLEWGHLLPTLTF